MLVCASMLTVVTLSLTGCTPGIPVAYKVTDGIVDIAFCRSFNASSVEIDFGKYPPPFMGSLYSIGVVRGSGPLTNLGRGRPVLSDLDAWTFDGDLVAPDGWERVDFSFYGENGEYVAGEFLFSRDVTGTDWAWTRGLNVNQPSCDVDLG